MTAGSATDIVILLPKVLHVRARDERERVPVSNDPVL